MGHKVSNCPNSKQTRGNNRLGNSLNSSADRPYTISKVTEQEAAGVEDVVTSMEMINSLPADVLFGCGACHSFISKKFA